MSESLKVISLFSGAGGLDYGLEAAGFSTAVAIDMDGDCCETLRLNRPNWVVLEDRLENIRSARLMEAARLKRGEAALLIGGPPCQPFSKSGYWSKGDTLRLSDPRAQTLEEYMRVVEDAIPQVLLLENVAGLSYKGKDDGIQFLLHRVEQINKKTGAKYAPSCQILRLVEYGVPQLRDRFFMIADREGRQFMFPTPTHRHPQEVGGQLGLVDPRQDPRTAWEAIGDLPEPDDREDLRVRGKWADLLPSIPEGENYLWHTDRKGGLPLFGWRTHYWGFLLKLAKNHPSWTIQAQPGSAIGPFHWTNRRLSTKEMLRLMTFPDISVLGGRTSVQCQLGNAVPSLMAEILGKEIRRQFFGQSSPHECRLIPPRYGPAPAPEPNADVPVRYLHLAGDHEPHPGTGKGPMAIRLRKSVPVSPQLF